MAKWTTGLEKYSRPILRDQDQDRRDQDRGLEDYITEYYTCTSQPELAAVIQWRQFNAKSMIVREYGVTCRIYTPQTRRIGSKSISYKLPCINSATVYTTASTNNISWLLCDCENPLTVNDFWFAVAHSNRHPHVVSALSSSVVLHYYC